MSPSRIRCPKCYHKRKCICPPVLTLVPVQLPVVQPNPVDEMEGCVHLDKQVSPHTCPFADEIHDDHTLCTCCEECGHECAMDI